MQDEVIEKIYQESLKWVQTCPADKEFITKVINMATLELQRESKAALNRERYHEETARLALALTEEEDNVIRGLQ